MQDAGIPTILLKGPSIARWLYPSGGRTYIDTDLLVPARDLGLHRNLPMLRAPDEFLWESLSAETETLLIGDVELPALGRTALALHVVVHAVQHRFQGHTNEDLRRAITVRRIRWTLLPSPAKIRHVSCLPDAHGPKLLLAHVRWWRDLAPAVVSAVRFGRGRQRLAKGGGDGW
jgi:hypothetical protein